MQKNAIYIIGLLVLIILAFFMFAKPATQDNARTDTYNTASTTNSTDATTATSTSSTTQTQENIKATNNTKDMQTIKMETNKGTIVLELNPKIAPKTVENFVKLASTGFYNGTKFHRVIEGFMIQAGDPQSKDDKLMNSWGTGGPGYKFADEITDAETYRTGYKRGVLAMANSGPNTNGSQFFIMHRDTPLPPNYTIFGKIKDGDVASFKTVDAIATSETLPNDRPTSAIVITKVTVE